MEKKWTGRLAGILLAITAVGGVALAAGTQGSQSDPLVSLSYLNEVFLPELMQKVEDKLSAREKELESELGEGPFAVVDVASGKTVTLSLGSQVLLQSGSATGSPMLDTTAGSTLSGTGALTANHLYLATQDGQTVKATGACVFLIQGEYTVS